MSGTVTDREPVALYIRFRGNEPEVNVERQRSRLSTYCAKHRLKIVRTYIDVGVSTNDAVRPAFNEMLNAIETSPPFCAVVCMSSCRIARCSRRAGELREIFAASGVQLRFIADHDQKQIERTAERIVRAIGSSNS